MATLLIVDDETAVREMLYELFSATYECHTADRAEQALEYLEIENYDVVITDISMPGLGGVEILKRIKQLQPSTPVIVISGHMAEDVASLLELGAFAFFPKPFRLEEVEDAVVKAIAHRQRQGASG
jgi:DNA-binding NtrC family response regulator